MHINQTASSPKNFPGKLYRDATLRYFNLNRTNEYRKYVMMGMKNFSLFEMKGYPILGSENFVKKIKEEKIKKEPILEIPEHGNLIKNFYPDCDEVIRVVAKYYNKNLSDILDGDLKRDISRKVAIYLCYQLTGENYKFLSQRFKKISVFGIAKICQRFESLIKKDHKLLEDINYIKGNLSNVQT